jgi:predicted AAA+ superfamily ATPase
MLERYLLNNVRNDLRRKMVFISGPRQSGKTTLAKRLLGSFGIPSAEQSERYHNWDSAPDREMIMREQAPAQKGLHIYDEIHKYGNWRQYIKGLFDKYSPELTMLVTGSARLDYYRHGGDSLQGRYHFYRMHTLTYREIQGVSAKDLSDLLMFSGFPEPFLMASETEARRWSREYRARLISEQIIGLEQVRQISSLEKMALRLPDLVGSPLSINSLREDLNAAHQTVAHWIDILERMYVLFRIYPFGGPSIRAVKKEPKHYHFDWTQIGDPAARFECLIACHLLKWCHFQADTAGWDMELRYFRDVDRREVDFVVVKEKTPLLFVECKTSARTAAPALCYLHRKYPQVPAWQVCLEDIDVRDKEGIRICHARHLLDTLV